MKINSRSKGAAGEREVAAILRDELRLEIRRNWQEQSAVGGSDLQGVPGWAVEVKRQKVARLSEWWTQTAMQANRAFLKPVLIYRLDRQPWFAMMSMMDLRADVGHHSQVTMTLEAWCAVVRRDLNSSRTEC